MVACDGRQFELEGRQSVFDGPSDFAYVGRDSEFTMTSADVADSLCGARASTTLPFRYGPRAGVPVELRGAGNCSRQVHSFGTADVFGPTRSSPARWSGNWSSYPAHKHDENSEVESQLEEIYYFEFSQISGSGAGSEASGPNGFGYHRVYGTPERPIEVLEEVPLG